MIRIFVTGGTFDKTYDEIEGTLTFGDTHLPEMLRLGRCHVDVSVRTLMMVDSLAMTADDRAIIVRNCLSCEESRILVTHGTGFNWPEPDHFRMVTLPDVTVLEEAITRIADFFATRR